MSLGALDWNPSLTVLVVLGVLGGVTVLAALRAWRRLGPGRPARRLAVLLFNVLALGAMAALLAPPTVEREASAVLELLTEGAEAAPAAGADRFILSDEMPAEAGGVNPDASSRAQTLRTLGQLPLRRPDLDRLRVLGHGLAPEALAALPADVALLFDPPALTGPVEVQWPAVLESGEALVVTGALRLPDERQVADLRLLDPAGVIVAEEAVLSGREFGLVAVPRATGALEYRLQVVRGDTVLTDDPVGVFVRSPRGGRLLVLQSAPSFDTRQLAAWAADRGHPLVVRSQVSRDRELVQGINLPEGAALDLAPSLLEATDLAIVDGRRWASLEPARRDSLLAAVRSGLGLMLLADAELAEWLATPANAAIMGLSLAPAPVRDPVWPSWTGAVPERPLPLAPYRLESTFARQGLVSENGRVLEAWAPLGQGRIGVSLLRERHRWATSGDRSTFSRYWNRALRQLGRPASKPAWQAPDAGLRPRPGARLPVCATPGGAVQEDDAPLAFRQTREESLAGPGTPLVLQGLGAPLACGQLWPAEAGWRRLELLDGTGATLDEVQLRVYEPSEWRTAERARRQAATRARAADPEFATDGASRRMSVPLSPWWAWTVLLLAGGLLWAERRLFELD